MRLNSWKNLKCSPNSVSYYHWNGVLLPKTKVNGGYCYIDYDHVDACLLRPIFKADPGKMLLGQKP